MNDREAEVCTFSPPGLERTALLTVDVEDYFMSPECVPLEAWPSYPSMIHLGMERVLRLLEEYHAQATFFFLGWVAEHYPEWVRRVVEQGHELATHTYDHTFVSHQTPCQYERSVRRSLEILRGLAPEAMVCGHRAPAFSLDRNQPWQFEILRANGIIYDSSINPHGTYLYGDRSANRFPYRLHGLVEIPPSAVEWAGMRFPAGGGGTLRILPEWYLSRARRRYLREGYPPVIYIHPWEFVPEHQITLPWKLSCIHWTGIRTAERKIRAILEEFRTMTLRAYVQKLIG